MKTLFAAVLFVILAAPAPAWQSKQKWKPYIYPDDGFSITLPSQPIPQNDQGDPHIHLYSIRLQSGGVFSLRVVHRLTDCETTLADLWDKAEANKDANEPVIRGSLKQVSLADLKGVARHLLNAMTDPPAVHRRERQCLEHEHVERAR